MCKVISIVNQKGGCSKTTSAVNIGIGLANAGKKVVLIDADAQGSLTASLGFQKPDELKVTLATIMAKTINEEEIDLSKVILHHEEGVDLVPGNIELSGLEVQLSNVLSRELILKEFIDSLRDFYDYILIDCAPKKQMLRSLICKLLSSRSTKPKGGILWNRKQHSGISMAKKLICIAFTGYQNYYLQMTISKP